MMLRVLTIAAAAVLATAPIRTDAAANTARPAGPAVRHSVGMTPDECIRINGGDYNACNVGNSGRGDLPYRPVR